MGPEQSKRCKIRGARAGVVFFYLQENTESDPKHLQGTASPNKTRTLQATESTLDLHVCGTRLREIFGLLWFKNNTSYTFCAAEMETKIHAIFAIFAITVVPYFGRKICGPSISRHVSFTRHSFNLGHLELLHLESGQ